MLPPPPIRGIFRTDQRARAAYAEGAGSTGSCPPPSACRPTARTSPRSCAGRPRTACRWCRAAPAARWAAATWATASSWTSPASPAPAGRRPGAAASRAPAPASRCAELNRAADRARAPAPARPSSGRWATLGGMLSTNAAGARSVRYGSVRRWVERARAGDRRRRGARLRARAQPRPPASLAVDRFEADAAPAIRAAADLIARPLPPHPEELLGLRARRLARHAATCSTCVIGAEGTLGIVTAVDVAARPDARRAAPALRVALRSLDALADVVAALLVHEPSAVELLDRTFLELVGPTARGSARAEAVLLVELERDDPAAARQAVERGRGRRWRPGPRSVDTALTAAAAERLWALRHAASPILAGLPEDAPVAAGDRGRLRAGRAAWATTCAPCARRRPSADLAVVIFGHAGDGHVHVNLLPEIGAAGLGGGGGVAARGGHRRARPARRHAVAASTATAGSAPDCSSGSTAPRSWRSSRRVKRAFDPLGILNPGVILPGADARADRAGSRSARTPSPLPDDIARGLRTHRAARAATPRLRLELARRRPDPTHDPDPYDSHGHPSRRPASPSSPARSSSSRPTCRSSGRARRPTASGSPSSPAGSAT